MTSSAINIINGLKQDIGRGIYRLGAMHVGKMNTNEIYKTMDCSSFASQVLGLVLGKDHVQVRTTREFSSNPFGFQEISGAQVKNLAPGQCVQFNWTGSSFGHTGFIFNDGTGLKVAHFTGGRMRQFVLGDVKGMIGCVERHNGRFFLVSGNGKMPSNMSYAREAFQGTYQSLSSELQVQYSSVMAMMAYLFDKNLLTSFLGKYSESDTQIDNAEDFFDKQEQEDRTYTNQGDSVDPESKLPKKDIPREQVRKELRKQRFPKKKEKQRS